MDFFFNVKIEFNHTKLEELVKSTAKDSKGYCCFIDLTSLVYSQKNKEFRTILNSSLANSCDGSYIAMSASKIHKKKLKEYIGPDFFKKFIYTKKKQLIIGNTEEVFKKTTNKVNVINGTSDNLSYLSLPFLLVNDFDYQEIANIINESSPDYIWVSLGAPKQEEFMFNLLPFIDKGIMLGVGAALNYFTGEIKDIPDWTKKIHVIWLYRLFTEPKKQIKRLKSILITFPKMLMEERNKAKNK